MKYANIKKAGISHEQIRKAFGYKNRESFRKSSKHQIIMKGLDELLEAAFKKIEYKL